LTGLRCGARSGPVAVPANGLHASAPASLGSSEVRPDQPTSSRTIQAPVGQAEIQPDNPSAGWTSQDPLGLADIQARFLAGHVTQNTDVFRG